MIDYFSGVHTEFFLLGRGNTLMIFMKACIGESFFLKDGSSYHSRYST